jgi:KaiC/GvpD/RAD55 family RecA-like ATPase
MSFGNQKTNSESVREDRHPLGISILDEEVLRGVPKGSTIAILGDPDSSSEMILHSLASTGRKTEYITTLRSEYGIIDDIMSVTDDEITRDQIEDNLTIRDVRSDADEFGDIVRKSIQIVEDGNLIIDSFSMYHDMPKEMQNLARRIHMKTKQGGGITYLYFTANGTEDLSRPEKEILQMVDGVFNIQTQIIGNDQIENNLFINKLRGVDIPSEAQNLVFGRGLTIDVTADIG